MHHPTEKGTHMSNPERRRIRAFVPTVCPLRGSVGLKSRTCLANLLCVKGSGAPVFALALLLSLAIFGFSTAPARAEVVHKYLSQITEIPAIGPHGEAVAESGPLGEVNSMTFDSGDLWVGESGRVDEFNASGGFVSQLPVPFAGGSVAVGHANGETQLYAGGGTDSPAREVFVFDPTTKVQIGTWTGAGTPAHEFAFFGGVRGIAVDNSSNLADEARGDVYVADNAYTTGCIPEYGKSCVPPAPPQDEEVVDVFEPQAGGGEKYVTQLTGTCPTEGMTVGGPGCEEAKGLIPFPFARAGGAPVVEVVVDQSNGDVFVAEGSAVDVFEPLVLDQYRFVRQLPIGAISAMGGGQENSDIYAGPSEYAGPNQFSPAGVFLGELTGTPYGPFDGFNSVAVDDEPSSLSFEHVYIGDKMGVIDEFGPNVVIPDVTTTAATQATPTGATLNGEVDPLEAETHEGAECWFVWGTTTAFGEKMSCSELVAEHEGFVGVHARV